MAHRVLVAEDERNIVDALTFLMERAGLEVQVASDGPSTVRMARACRPDLLLLDLMLPGLDGFSVLARLNADQGGRRFPVIVLSAKGSELDRRKAEALGVNDYVTKPFSNRDVVARVKALLESGS